MTDKKQERANRNRERSEEAHWKVAEAGGEGEEEERLSERAHQAKEQQDDWDNEGGAPRSRPEQETTEQGD